MSEPCIRCEEVGEDRRTLFMECGYQMMKLDIPFEKELITNSYSIRVCKNCRGDWLAAIKDWFYSIPTAKSCGSGIFVRVNGATREVSEYEFKMMYPDREPFRIVNPEFNSHKE